ncbi:unnamed protein product [Mytilus coruscus]|uniref:Tyr recombinase domain-containing protein n=1 Tax=Mytilus coruscus TaxID=42192 RepID=A0A6J8DX32_MYTCO|nr:unnamed protein product [Mytilus coruscus]
MKDLTFKKSRDCLMAKKKHLKELGLGNLPNAAEAIESDEEEELFSSGAFGTGNPDSLLAAIWQKLTNHSGRKTAITRLLDEGMPVTAAQQHTGHKSLESINNYAKNSIKTQKKMCDILDKSKSVNLDSKSKVTKSEKAATSPNPESNPEFYINVEEIQTALNERPESTISSTGNRPQPFEFLPKGTVINGGTLNFVFGSNDWDPNKNQNENISPPEPKRLFRQ